MLPITFIRLKANYSATVEEAVFEEVLGKTIDIIDPQ